MFEPSLGTHFNAQIDRDTLREVRGFGFRWARMDCQTCSVEIMAAMIADCNACDLTPLPIVYDLERLGALEALAVEWGNEPDGDIAPATYREQLKAACVVALERSIRLYAPAISNLDWDSLQWLEQVRGGGWPSGLHGVSVHRYGDGTFEYAHAGFASRADEVARLLELCDGLPFLVTEFGYPTYPVAAFERRAKRTRYLKPDLHLSEAEQAANIAKEWEFWRAYTDVPILYQINDGIHADEGYGIRRCLPDGTLTDWKQAAYEVPKGAPMEPIPMPTANSVFATADLIAVPEREGEYGLRYPMGADTILSPKASGVHELRDLSYLGGADETCKVAGDLVYFPIVNGRRFAWRLAE